MRYIKVKSGPHVGDVVTLKHDHSSMAATFEKGTEVQIIGFGVHGYDICDQYGNTMTQCGWDL